MSSAAIYRVSKDTWAQLELDTKPKFDISNAKSYAVFQGSYLGLEYILCKGQDISTTELIKKIFSPSKCVGGLDFGELLPEEQFELWSSGSYIPYLESTTISEINKFFDKFSIHDIHSKYNAKELNDNGIYPCVWHNDNSPNLVINERQLVKDFTELKKIFKLATLGEDYLLVLIG